MSWLSSLLRERLIRPEADAIESGAEEDAAKDADSANQPLTPLRALTVSPGQSGVNGLGVVEKRGEMIKLNLKSSKPSLA